MAREKHIKYMYTISVMSNRHIKTINGKKYYYSSVRLGKKVTSKYIGPVESKRKKRPEEQEALYIN